MTGGCLSAADYFPAMRRLEKSSTNLSPNPSKPLP
jgi:hypothetical protein